MTIKQTAEGDDELVQETMADRLKKVQNETWRKMRYVHEESAESWAVSEEVLYTDHGNDKEEAEDVAMESGGSAAATQVHAGGDLVDKLAGLSTGWREEKMLETTSGIKNPEGVVKVEISDDDAADGVAASPAASRAKGKGKAKATTTAAAGTIRGKRASTTTTTTTGFTSINKEANNTAKASPSTKAKKSKS